jgi:penicillin-binding protein 1A
MPRNIREKRRRARLVRRLIVLSVVAAIMVATLLVTVFAGSVLFASVLQNLPTVDRPLGAVAQKTRIYSADGVLLATLYAENREPVKLTEMSPYFKKAIIAVEDERYYTHPGVDPEGIARAAVKDLQTGRAAEGASTITQQFVRTAFLTQDKTFARKVREAVLAYRLEKRYSKDQILGMYLNTIYFGEGAYGIQSAAYTYFSKQAKDLTLPEAALLAGLPKSPNRLSPFDNPKAARARRAVVLDRMVATGAVPERLAKAAKRAPITLKRGKSEQGPVLAPYFVEFVKQELLRKYGADKVFRGGLAVTTTLDTKLQRYAEEAVRDNLPYNDDPDASLTAIDPRNGWVRAMYGGRDFKKQKFNLAAQGRRQPGSSFKTFVLVAALEDGIPPNRYLRSNSPITIPMPKPQKPWIVNNSEGMGEGIVSIETATHSSINVVFAQLIMDVGAKRVAKLAKRMGIMSTVPPVPAIALGGLNPGVTTYDMATAYGTLANRGIHVTPTGVQKIVTPTGRILYKHRPVRARSITEAVAHTAVGLLKGVISGGTGHRADIGRPAAGKTGTSQNYRDAWFAGFTPQMSCAVWVGYTKTEKPMTDVHGIRVFGGTFPAEIWHDFMSRALAGEKPIDFAGAPNPKYRWEDGWYDAGDAYYMNPQDRQTDRKKSDNADKNKDTNKDTGKDKGGTGGTTKPKPPPPPPPPPPVDPPPVDPPPVDPPPVDPPPTGTVPPLIR